MSQSEAARQVGVDETTIIDSVFFRRMAVRYEELKSLYCGLYHNDMAAFEYFCGMLERSFNSRKASLRMLDAKRLADPDWFCSNQLMGMMLYGNAFARNLKSVREKLSYLEEYGVNYLHLMSFLASPKGRSDGGYAVADFRTVLPESEAMDDLESLADDCREKGISLCLDFVMNHTSENHAWTKAAREGDQLAKSRYFFYDNWDEPDRYEQTAPQIFSAAAPGNFTWQEDCGKVVMTTFYPLRQHRPALRDQQVGCHGSAQNSYTPPAGVIISRLWVFFVGMWIIRAPRQRIRPATEGSSISISVICSCFRHL